MGICLFYLSTIVQPLSQDKEWRVSMCRRLAKVGSSVVMCPVALDPASTREGSGVITCLIALDLASPLGRALVSSCVPRLWILPFG
jgi:hypothetical protein